LCGTIITLFASFKGAALFLRTIRVGMRCQVQYPQTAAVMRRFERVVALPDSKLVISLSRINTLHTAGLQHTVNARFCPHREIVGSAQFENYAKGVG